MNDPRNIHAHAHAMLVEKMMALHGRASSDPKTYRRVLERMSSDTLRRAIDESNFPALEQYDAHSLDARSQTLVGPTPVRESSELNTENLKLETFQ